MKPDALLLSADVLNDVDAGDIIRALASEFVACGGSITLAEFAALSRESRRAIIEARHALDRVRAAALVDAVSASFGDPRADSAAAALLEAVEP